MAKPLSTKQLAFVEHYLQCWSETEAARRAGYANPNNNAHRLMVNDGVATAIQTRLAELKMSADEVLTRLADHARGSIAPFLFTTSAGEPIGFNLSPDRPLHLVKKVSITDKGASIELHDSQTALALLGKAHGLFVERTEVSGPGGGPIPTEAYDYSAAVAIVTQRSSDDSDSSG